MVKKNGSLLNVMKFYGRFLMLFLSTIGAYLWSERA